MKGFESLLKCIGWIFILPKKLVGFFFKSKWYTKILLSFVGMILAFLLLILAIDLNFCCLFGESPTAEQIEYTAQAEASEIYSADGKLMGKYFSENRSPVTFDEISDEMIKTLICTEDARFYEHHGIDFRGLVSAFKDFVNGKARGASTITQQLAKNLFKMRSDNVNTGLLCKVPGVKMLITKLKEWIVAYKIESKYSKNEILTMYLNTVDFGSNAFGIRTAAKTYFGVHPQELTYEQSAVLVGLLKATSYYNPRINKNNALNRRNVVYANLRDFGYITKAEYEEMCLKDIVLNYNVEKNYDGWGLYFRDAVSNYLRSWRKKNKINIYTAGLKIYTTVDSTMQAYAEHAVVSQMKEIQRRFNNHWDNEDPWQDERHHVIDGFVEKIAKKTDVYAALYKKFKGDSALIFQEMNKPHKLKVFDYKVGKDTFYYYDENEQLTFDVFDAPGRKDTLMSSMDSIRYMLRFMHASFVALEPNTGHIKAWVGDLDFESWKFDKVTAYRQPGSTFKLFDYTEALKQGMSPCEERRDEYVSWEVWDKGKRVKWTPHNADVVCTGREFSLKAAFARSINTIAVQVSKDCGIANINRTARDMGIKSFLNDTVPATCLGACDLSLLELTNAYCTVINDGVAHEPVLVTRIEDRDGKVIFESPNTDKKVLDYEVAFLMQDMLRGGLTEPEGTVAALWEYIHPVLTYKDSTGKTVKNTFGGKTGTSSNHSDAWFIGVTPNLVAGSWVGGEFRSIHFRTGELGQGSRTALPIFGKFARLLFKNPDYRNYGGPFPAPKERIMRDYNCKRYFNPSDEEDESNWDAEGADAEIRLDED